MTDTHGMTRAEAAEKERDDLKTEQVLWRTNNTNLHVKNDALEKERDEWRIAHDKASRERDHIKAFWGEVRRGQSGCACRFEADGETLIESCAFHGGIHNAATEACKEVAKDKCLMQARGCGVVGLIGGLKK